eukprot:TRINITY_DN1086_c0_g1_i2.p1 TRINITY_DN1086_c0_g1~~TRINITY_DN1086_c0_g1_i2.p1  ORF type:complete len:180 (-),score=26.25 TRINITY_DN1086_c0_g1_i2:39-578(-)
MAILQRPLFREISDVVYGKHAAISIYRAMMFNKPIGTGLSLPWHQDGGDWWSLDRDPLFFVWIAIDPATTENGCVQVIPGSHKSGILSQRGHTLTNEQVEEYCADEKIVNLECSPGEAYLCHNFLIHKSGDNKSSVSRRGISFNFTDARTKVLDPKPELSGPVGEPGQSFPVIFPSPFE